MMARSLGFQLRHVVSKAGILPPLLPMMGAPAWAARSWTCTDADVTSEQLSPRPVQLAFLKVSAGHSWEALGGQSEKPDLGCRGTFR